MQGSSQTSSVTVYSHSKLKIVNFTFKGNKFKLCHFFEMKDGKTNLELKVAVTMTESKYLGGKIPATLK